eukprot:5349625-Pleurochrysis_carterae.AAC.2
MRRLRAQECVTHASSPQVENEEPEPVLTNLMGEVIAPKHAPLKPRRLKPLWSDVDGDALVRHTLGRKTDSYCWQQSTTQARAETRRIRFSMYSASPACGLFQYVVLPPVCSDFRIGSAPQCIAFPLCLRPKFYGLSLCIPSLKPGNCQAA